MMKAKYLRLRFTEIKLTLPASDERARQILALIDEIIQWIEHFESENMK